MQPGDRCNIWFNNRPTGNSMPEYKEVVALAVFERFGKTFFVHHEMYLFSGASFIVNGHRFQVSEKETGVRIGLTWGSEAEAMNKAIELLHREGKRSLFKFLRDTRKEQKRKAVEEAAWRLSR